MSAAWPSGLEGRFYDGHVRKIDGSTPGPKLGNAGPPPKSSFGAP